MGGLATRAGEKQEIPECQSATGGQNHLRAMKKNGITVKRREGGDRSGRKKEIHSWNDNRTRGEVRRGDGKKEA